MTNFDDVKLVIWDLDDTFWTGTLTEGGIEYESRFHDAVVNLTRQGIINSICSNNDLDHARQILADNGIWEYFVFPAISWSPKPLLIQSIIDNTQLGARNTVVLDDNARIRDEVRAAIPALLPPLSRAEFYAAYCTHFLAGQSRPPGDTGLERLAHYKILERKYGERQRLLRQDDDHSDAAFLRSCKIRCSFIQDVLPLAGRIDELLKRTNQLNFTKWDITEAELIQVLGDPGLECRAIQVVDRFGDYGVCGFFALDRSRNQLRHFLFSCRVLHMGLEEAVYAHLGCPEILASETAASSRRLSATAAESIDWIEFGLASGFRDSEPDYRGARKAVKVHLTGGCELEPLAIILSSSLGDGAIEKQLMNTNSQGVSINVYGASSLIRLSSEQDLVAEYRYVLNKIPWLDESCFRPSIFSGAFDVCFLSTQRDFMLANYRHRSGRFSIPAEYYEGVSRADFSRKDSWPRMLDAVRKRNGPIDAEFPRWFADAFRFEGPIQQEEYQDYLRWLSSEVPARTTLVLINTAEVTKGAGDVNGVDWFSPEDVRAQWEYQCLMNRALDEVIGELPNVRLLDVRKFIRSHDDVHDLTHWTRHTHLEFAKRVLSLLKDMGMAEWES